MECKKIFDLCSEGEEVIKSYECTKIKKLFFGESKGYITLTNKRLLYHAKGKSIRGSSIVLNEMPIDDITGINTYIGAAFNWGYMVLFILCLEFLGKTFIFERFPRSLTSKTFGLIVIVPFMLLWLWRKEILSEKAKEIIIDKIKRITDSEQMKKINFNHIRVGCYYLCAYGVFIIGGNITYYSPVYIRIIPDILIYFMLFGVRESFSLVMFSKATKGTGISISGVQSIIGMNDRTAVQTASGSPAKDSNLVAKELGAIITDFKQMGDMAIEKWKENMV